MTDANQSFRLDTADILGLTHRKFVLRMREMLKTDPLAYERARVACRKSLIASMVKPAQNAIYIFLREGTGVDSRGEPDGECLFGKDGDEDIKPNYPQPQAADISLEIAQKTAEFMEAQIEMLFPTLAQVLESERLEKLADERHERYIAKIAQKAKLYESILS